MNKQAACLMVNKLIKKSVLIVILFLISFSCKKEKSSIINYNFQVLDIACFPYDSISMTFRIIPVGDNSPFKLTWYEPSGFEGEGPFTIEATDNLLLDFEIRDAGNSSKRFSYIIHTDTIDSLQNDYRNRYAGSYSCNVTYTYNGDVEYSTDTLVVEKNDDFKLLTISNRSMFYNGGNSFYGYHSFAAFTNDSIYYSESVPLGYYYTNIYKGVRINK